MPQHSIASSKKVDAKPHKISKKQPPLPEKNLSAEAERFSMIAEAAYYRALGREFNGGDEVEDWLLAEAEVDNMQHDWEDPDSRLATVD